MWDLTVTTDHDFYIQAAADAILVHNCPELRVIGHYDDYVQLGKQIGAKYFNVPEDIWSSMSPDEQWAANPVP